MSATYRLTPLESDMMSAMPMMPMDPASATRMVRAFFVHRLLNESASAVPNDMEALPMFLWTAGLSPDVSGSNGSVSSSMMPSFKRTMRVAYFSASSALWVTITTRRSLATSFSRSMTWMLVSESSAPVGSSASRISGSLTRARAMATRCIWPPEIWFGLLCICSARPTFSSASSALLVRSALEMPLMVSASSTLDNSVWCGMRL